MLRTEGCSLTPASGVEGRGSREGGSRACGTNPEWAGAIGCCVKHPWLADCRTPRCRRLGQEASSESSAVMPLDTVLWSLRASQQKSGQQRALDQLGRCCNALWIPDIAS